MPQTNISIRVDEEVKRNAENLFAQLGLTLSSATNVFFRQAIRTKGIPFIITTIDQKIVDGGVLLREALCEAQEQSKRNGNNKMELSEINNIIAEVRHDKGDE